MAQTNADTTKATAADQNHMGISLPEGDLTGRIIKCFYRVYDALGFGFLESVYRQALLLHFGPKAKFQRLIHSNAQKPQQTLAG